MPRNSLEISSRPETNTHNISLLEKKHILDALRSEFLENVVLRYKSAAVSQHSKITPRGSPRIHVMSLIGKCYFYFQELRHVTPSFSRKFQVNTFGCTISIIPSCSYLVCIRQCLGKKNKLQEWTLKYSVDLRRSVSAFLRRSRITIRSHLISVVVSVCSHWICVGLSRSLFVAI